MAVQFDHMVANNHYVACRSLNQTVYCAGYAAGSGDLWFSIKKLSEILPEEEPDNGPVSLSERIKAMT